MEYGVEANWNLNPCYTLDEFNPAVNDNCWAMARDEVDGDVTAGISVEQLDTGGSQCDHQTIVSGTCEPGTYVFVYKATDAEGNAAVPGVTVVNVVLKAAVSFETVMMSSKTTLAAVCARFDPL
jgi:hypothetical protein